MSSPLFEPLCSPTSEQFAQDVARSVSGLEFSDGETVGSHDTVHGTRFRFTKRFCILTYSQTPPDFDPDEIVRILHRACRGCIVARESHLDGGTHYHAFVDYGTPRDWTNPRRWDVLGMHPNVKPVSRTPFNAYAYVGKDKNVVHDCFSDATRPRPARQTGDAQRNRKRAWAEIANASNKDEFLRNARRWILVLLSHASATFPDTQITPFRIYEDNMSRQPESRSTSPDMDDCENISPVGLDSTEGTLPELFF